MVDETTIPLDEFLDDETLQKINDPEYLATLNKFLESINDLYFKQKGLHSGGNQALITKGFNYYGEDYTLPHKEHHGLVFFSRPKLNFSTGNLAGHRLFSFLNTTEPNSVGFAIRCLLDPIFASKISSNASKSMLFDINNPFIPIITNRISNISGFPDMVMETKTTEGGYYSENMTIAKGWDGLAKSYDLTTTFSDVRGGFILSLFLMWFLWMDCVIKGSVIAYKKYREEIKICYSFSIYRFLMDETNTFITKWSKCTGCFPINVPLGAYFNFDSNNPYVMEAANLSIPIKVAGAIEYMDPIIFWEFNELVERYCPNIKSYQAVGENDWHLVNGKTIPYIDTSSGYNKMLWLADETAFEETTDITNEDTEITNTNSQDISITTDSITNDTEEIYEID